MRVGKESGGHSRGVWGDETATAMEFPDWGHATEVLLGT